MALTAKFVADFSSFYKAVQDATAKLDGFQKEADQVSGSLNKMVESLSGKELITQATLMARAVGEIGGASKLTDTELKRVGSTVSEAAQKMERMGIAVPKSFQDITKAAAGVKEPTETWGTSMKTLTGIVQGFMGLQLVQWFGKAAAAGFEWASSLTKMKNQTELSYRDLQILQDVSIATGSGMESLAKGIQVMQLRIGDRTARKAIQELGLDFDRLLKMSPADQFAEIAGALGKIKDPTEFATAAFKIFGGTYRELTPAIRADIKNIAKDTKLIGDAHIEAADRASSEWAKAWNDIKKGSVTYLGWLAAKDRERREEAEQEAARIAKILRPPAADIPTLPGPPVGVTKGLGPFVQDVDPQMITDLEVLGETLDKQSLSVGKNTAQWKAWQEIADRTSTATRALTKEQAAQVDAWSKAGVSASTAATALAINEKAVADYLATQRLLSQEIPTTNAALADFRDLVSKGQIEEGLRQIRRDTEALTDTLPAFTNRMKQNAEMFPDWVAPISDLPKIFGKGTTEAMPMLMRFGSNVQDFFANDFGRIVVAGITGGGNVIKGALTGFGNTLFAKEGAFGNALSRGVEGLFGKDGMMGKIGKTIGDMVPMIGSFVGPAIEGITKLFSKVFGKSEESKSVSPLRDEFFALQGGLDQLNPRVQALTGNLKLVQAVFDAKTVEQYNAAIANLNNLFEQEKTAIEAVNATAQKYGITIQELGPAMQRQQLDKQAQQLYKDWQILNSAGIQTTVVTARMSTAINAYIKDAMGMGTEVPIAMKPMLEQMIAMGTLTDASGNKIENLEDSGISFAMSMSEGFKSLITEVQKLTEMIGRSLGTAVDATARKLRDFPKRVPVEFDIDWNTPTSGGKVPGFQGGTDGKYVDFGAGTLAMLHGREAIIPESNRSLVGSGGLGTGAAAPIVVTIDARGALFGPGSELELARMVERALSNNYNLKHTVRAA